jgi:DNA-binding response OmpR family regulator
MPGMDGFEFVRNIRMFNQFMPIVITSSSSSREHFKEYLEIGVDEFLEKPFTAGELLAVMQRIEKTLLLRESLVSMSRLTFRAFVSLEKMEHMNSVRENHVELSRERKHFLSVLADMRDLTVQLLSADRANKKFHR